MAQPVVVVRSRHSPHKIVFLGFGLLLGLAYTFGAPPPSSTVATQPQWLIRIWAIGLVLHGLIGFAGILAPKRHLERGLLLELGSMFIGAGALVVVATAVFVVNGSAALFGGGLSVAWAVANVFRAGQILRDLRDLKVAA